MLPELQRQLWLPSAGKVTMRELVNRANHLCAL
jgi:hypothetical protein